jgi:glucuronate isomerase
MPIIDYHCHLSPQQIAEDIKFENITQAWLYGDHYKWRAMRTSGVDESYCTGNKSDYEKFEKWAATVPYTMRNPLYHWTHLELRRYFGIHEILDPSSAKSIYENASAQIQTDAFSIKNLIRKMNVKVFCTTDDPIDSLEYHKTLSESDFEVKIKPAFRPDKAMEVVSAANFIAYVKKLEAITNLSVSTFNDYLFALQNRHDFFASMGCSVSDHGLEEIYVEDFTGQEIETIFSKVYGGKELNLLEQRKFKSWLTLNTDASQNLFQ